MCGKPDKPGCGKAASSAPNGSARAAAAPAAVSQERWLGVRWVGVPDPIRRHIARALGLRQVPSMPGCGCTVRGILSVGRWRARGGLWARMAPGLVWMAGRGSAALGVALSVYLAFRPPGPHLRRLLGQTIVAAVGRGAPTKVTRIHAAGKIDKEAISKVAREARAAGKPIGEAVRAYLSATARQPVTADRSATTASQERPAPSSIA